MNNDARFISHTINNHIQLFQQRLWSLGMQVGLDGHFMKIQSKCYEDFGGWEENLGGNNLFGHYLTSTNEYRSLINIKFMTRYLFLAKRIIFSSVILIFS